MQKKTHSLKQILSRNKTEILVVNRIRKTGQLFLDSKKIRYMKCFYTVTAAVAKYIKK